MFPLFPKLPAVIKKKGIIFKGLELLQSKKTKTEGQYLEELLKYRKQKGWWRNDHRTA